MVPISAESGTAFFEGAVKKIGNDAFQFPLGKGTVWAPLDIINPPNLTDEFTAEYFGSAYPSLSPLGAGLDHVSPAYYWQLDQNNGTSSINVKLYWKNDLGGVDDLSTLRVARWTGSIWENLGGITSGNPNSDGDCRTSSPVPTTPLYGPFTLASTDPTTNPMPVELLSFDAGQKDEAVELTWKTASERNCDYFSVERSADGTEFTKMAKVHGSGTTSSSRSYSSIDADPLAGLSYYRLRQVDFDGTVSFSDIVPVRFNADGVLNVFPTVSSGNITVDLQGEQEQEIRLSIRNVFGEEVYSVSMPPAAEKHSYPIDLSGTLTPGLYFVSAEVLNRRLERKIVIR